MNKNHSDDNESEDIESNDEAPAVDGDSKLTSDVDTSGQQEKKSTEPTETGETKKTPMYVILVGIVLTLLVIACLQVDDWSRDWATNYAETDPAAKDIDLRPIESELSARQLSQLVTEKMSDATRWTLSETKEIDKDQIEIALVHKTFWFGFKDDVNVKIDVNENGSILNVTSQSRIGKGDLGQNPRNIKELVSIIRAALANRDSNEKEK